MPNSSPTTSADLPLWSQFWTASRLKVPSNFRRSRTDVCFIGLVVHCSPYSLSVNSKQPQRDTRTKRCTPPCTQRNQPTQETPMNTKFQILLLSSALILTGCASVD